MSMRPNLTEPIENLGLPERTKNTLRAHGISEIGQLLDLAKSADKRLEDIPNIGMPSVAAIYRALFVWATTNNKTATSQAQVQPAIHELRDYFAGKAMQGLLANPKLQQVIEQAGGAKTSWIEVNAYAFADGMLKARAQ